MVEIYKTITEAEIYLFFAYFPDNEGGKLEDTDVLPEKGLEILTKHPNGEFSGNLVIADLPPNKKMKIGSVIYFDKKDGKYYDLRFDEFVELGSPDKIKIEQSTLITALNS